MALRETYVTYGDTETLPTRTAIVELNTGGSTAVEQYICLASTIHNNATVSDEGSLYLHASKSEESISQSSCIHSFFTICLQTKTLAHTLSIGTYGQYGVYYYVNKRLIYLYTFFTTGPPFIYDHNPLSSQVLLSVLSPIEFTCRSTGDPNPLVHWEKDGELLENGGRVVITPDTYGESDSVLYISETKATDTGSYECVSSNLAGEDSELFEVTVSGTVLAWPHHAKIYSN